MLLEQRLEVRNYVETIGGLVRVILLIVEY
jgi:hypothetical protein